MKIENRTRNRLSFTNKNGDFCYINIGEVAEVEENIAEILLTFDGVREFVAPVDVKKLEEENAKLKAQLGIKETKTKAKTTKKKGTKAK